MGEYAGFKGQSVKIGTCEDMYYLRFEQRALVTKEPHSLDPVECADELRFRFPWPDEDGCEPGSDFNGHAFDRSVSVPGFVADADVEHHTIQFTSTRPTGYVASLPCPESSAYVDGAHGRRQLVDGGAVGVHRNGFAGAVALCSQRYRPGIGLVPVLKCGGCGSMWRVEDRAGIEAVVVAFRSEADKERDQTASLVAFYHAIADRVLAGLEVR